jgi:hypothetical protein
LGDGGGGAFVRFEVGAGVEVGGRGFEVGGDLFGEGPLVGVESLVFFQELEEGFGYGFFFPICLTDNFSIFLLLKRQLQKSKISLLCYPPYLLHTLFSHPILSLFTSHFACILHQVFQLTRSIEYLIPHRDGRHYLDFATNFPGPPFSDRALTSPR